MDRLVNESVPGCGGWILVRRRATQEGAYPGYEFANAEGLGDVVIGAELEAEYFVELF